MISCAWRRSRPAAPAVGPDGPGATCPPASAPARKNGFCVDITAPLYPVPAEPGTCPQRPNRHSPRPNLQITAILHRKSRSGCTEGPILLGVPSGAISGLWAEALANGFAADAAFADECCLGFPGSGTSGQSYPLPGGEAFLPPRHAPRLLGRGDPFALAFTNESTLKLRERPPDGEHEGRQGRAFTGKEKFFPSRTRHTEPGEFLDHRY